MEQGEFHVHGMAIAGPRHLDGDRESEIGCFCYCFLSF